MITPRNIHIAFAALYFVYGCWCASAFYASGDEWATALLFLGLATHCFYRAVIIAVGLQPPHQHQGNISKGGEQ